MHGDTPRLSGSNAELKQADIPRVEMITGGVKAAKEFPFTEGSLEGQYHQERCPNPETEFIWNAC